MAANYAGPFNKNSQVHHVALKGKPRDNLTVGALYFDFDTQDTDQATSAGGSWTCMWNGWSTTTC